MNIKNLHKIAHLKPTSKGRAKGGGKGARERESRAGNVGEEKLDIFYDYCEIET